MKIGRFEIKRRENTVWDYVVPLSLVVMTFISFNYTFRGDLALTKFKVFPSLPIEFFSQTLNIFVFILLIIFLPRLYRIGTWFLGIFLLIVLDFIRIDLISIIIFFFILTSLSFSAGNLSLILIYGNNLTGKITRKPSAVLTALGFAIYGFYYDLLWFLTLFFPRPAEKPIILTDLGIWKFPYFYFIIFFFIGLAVEKYNQKRAAK